ncbi:MAG: hypothetical protein P1U46_00755 [Patescibacteria group bacterium]|nr:hypothetical protein [Patescibacteria group bacterium]
MEENDFSLEDKNSVLNLSYEYVSDFYLDIQEKLISFVEENNLVSDFYLEIIK